MSKTEFKKMQSEHGTFAAAWLARELGVTLANVQLWMKGGV